MLYYYSVLVRQPWTPRHVNVYVEHNFGWETNAVRECHVGVRVHILGLVHVLRSIFDEHTVLQAVLSLTVCVW